MEEDRRKGAVRSQYQSIKSVKNCFQPRSNMIETELEEMLVNEEDVRIQWKDYFKGLLNRPDPRNPLEDDYMDE